MANLRSSCCFANFVSSVGQNGPDAPAIEELKRWPPCEITFKGSAPQPFRCCPDSVLALTQPLPQFFYERRRPLKSFARDYEANRKWTVWFYLHPQDDGGGAHEAGQLFNTENLTMYQEARAFYRQNLIYDDKLDSLNPNFVVPPQAHCERLAFFSNFGLRPDEDWNMSHPEIFSGWFGPGGAQRNVPPVGVNKAVWPRVGAPAHNPWLRQLAQGYTYDDPAVPQTGPGASNPFRAAETQFCWCPSILGRAGDAPLNFVVPPTTTLAWGEGERKESYVGRRWVADDWSDEFRLEPGGYDWRFLNSVITRQHWSYLPTTPRSRTFYKRHYLMYWDLSTHYGIPSGLAGESGDIYSTETLPWLMRFYANRAGVPRRTLFDATIQAGVFACRMADTTIEHLRNVGYKPIILSDMDKNPGKRVWAYTQVKMQIRQAMPYPDPDGA